MLENETPASKKKVVAMAIAMLVPTLCWVFNGFMLSFQVLESGIGWSILTALVCGLIVFFIEKLVVMANGNGWLCFSRICIGIIVALLGSLAIDEVVFKNDIDISVHSLKEQYISDAKKETERQYKSLNNYSLLENKIEAAQGKYDQAESAVVSEADGTSGTKSHGVGKVTKLKQGTALNRKADLNNLLAQKKQKDALLDSTVQSSGQIATNSFNDHALLIRIKALFQLITKDKYMLVTYLLFSLLMFFFEFLVVLLKHTWKKTNYERKVEMIEEIGRKRMEFLSGQHSPLQDPGNYLPQLEGARSALRKSTSILN